MQCNNYRLECGVWRDDGHDVFLFFAGREAGYGNAGKGKARCVLHAWMARVDFFFPLSFFFHQLGVKERAVWLDLKAASRQLTT